MALDVNGRQIEVDEEGYLSNLNDWEKDIATVMAKEDDIELGDDQQLKRSSMCGPAHMHQRG